MRLKLRANTIASLDIRFPPGHYLRLVSISLPPSSTPFPLRRASSRGQYTQTVTAPEYALTLQDACLVKSAFSILPMTWSVEKWAKRNFGWKNETEMNRTSSLQSRLAVWGLKLCGGGER